MVHLLKGFNVKNYSSWCWFCEGVWYLVSALHANSVFRLVKKRHFVSTTWWWSWWWRCFVAIAVILLLLLRLWELFCCCLQQRLMWSILQCCLAVGISKRSVGEFWKYCFVVTDDVIVCLLIFQSEDDDSASVTASSVTVRERECVCACLTSWERHCPHTLGWNRPPPPRRSHGDVS